MFTLWLEYFIYFFLSPPSPFYPLLLSPLSRSSHSSFLPVASFNSSTHRQPKPLPSADNADPSTCPMPTQAPAQRQQCQLISSFSVPISLQSHFSSTLSLNLSSSQTPRPMIVGVGFWFCRRDWQNSVVAMTGFYVDGFYFYFDEWVLILLMDDEWGLLMVDEWWLSFSGFVVAFG